MPIAISSATELTLTAVAGRSIATTARIGAGLRHNHFVVELRNFLRLAICPHTNPRTRHSDTRPDAQRHLRRLRQEVERRGDGWHLCMRHLVTGGVDQSNR